VGIVPVVLVLIEVRVEVIEERRSSSSSADVKKRGDGEYGDDDKGNDGNKQLEVRQMGLHGDLPELICLRRA
jgi:hypothetical protein